VISRVRGRRTPNDWQSRYPPSAGWRRNASGWIIRLGSCPALDLARTRLSLAMPYLARRGTSALIPVEVAHGLETMAVDAYGRLYWSRAAVEAWGLDQTAGVLLHEAGHVLRNHHKRAKSLVGERISEGTQKRLNIAMDMEINDDSTEWDSRLKLPDDAILPSKFSLPDGLLFEEYYRLLPEGGGGGGGGAGKGQGAGEGQEQGEGDGEGPGWGEGGVDKHGSGVGAGQQPWEAGSPEESGIRGYTEEELDAVRRGAAHDIAAATHKGGHGRGTIPSGWRRWSESLLTKPKVPWQTLLSQWIRNVLDKRRGMTETSFRRPAKKAASVPYLRPGWVRPDIRAAAVVDTSGSMGDEDVLAALVEVIGLVKATGAPVDVIAVSAQAARIGKISSVAALSAKFIAPGGGTDMRVGIQFAEALRPRADVIVVLTDAETPWPSHPTRVPLVVGVIWKEGDSTALSDFGLPSWAHGILIDAADKKKR